MGKNLFLKTITIKLFGNAEKNQAEFDEKRNLHMLFRKSVTTITKNTTSEETGH